MKDENKGGKEEEKEKIKKKKEEKEKIPTRLYIIRYYLNVFIPVWATLFVVKIFEKKKIYILKRKRQKEGYKTTFALH